MDRINRIDGMDLDGEFLIPLILLILSKDEALSVELNRKRMVAMVVVAFLSWDASYRS